MANNGKHMAKNHPKTRSGALILAGMILTSAAAARIAIKADGKIDSDNKGIISSVSYASPGALVSGISSNYKLSDVYGITDTGLIFDYYLSELEGLTTEEQEAKINELIGDENLYLNVYNYVQNAQELPSIDFELVEVNMNNIDAIRNNPEVMGLVSKYCAQYRIEEDVIVALLANNVHDGVIDTRNPFGLNNFWNGHVDSSRTVFNYETNKSDDIRIMQDTASYSLENAIRYGIMVYAGSAKEANGITDDTIKVFHDGPNARNLTDNQLMNSEAFKNTIISYIATSKGTDRFKTVHTFTLSDNYSKEIKELYGHELTYEEICDIVDQINTQLIIDLNQNKSWTK